MNFQEAEEVEKAASDAETARAALITGITNRVHASVRRRTPFMSTNAANELAEDVAENVAAFLKGAFDL